MLQRIKVLPLPRNVHPDHNPGRRAARAKALTEAHTNDTGALYVDAARYPDRPNTYVAVAVKATTGDVYSACSVRAPTALQAEEVAIALALTHPRCTTVLSDSRSAIANYAKNTVCDRAVSTVQCRATSGELATPVTHIRWFPAHTSVEASGTPTATRQRTPPRENFPTARRPPAPPRRTGTQKPNKNPSRRTGKYYSGTGSAGDSSRPPTPSSPERKPCYTDNYKRTR